MRIQLTDGYIKNGETIKEVELKERITIGMEEQAFDMCVTLGKANNLISAEICSLAVATGLQYDEVRNLSSYDYDAIRREYHHFFYKTPKTQEQEKQANQPEKKPLTPEQA